MYKPDDRARQAYVPAHRYERTPGGLLTPECASGYPECSGGGGDGPYFPDGTSYPFASKVVGSQDVSRASMSEGFRRFELGDLQA